MTFEPVHNITVIFAKGINFVFQFRQQVFSCRCLQKQIAVATATQLRLCLFCLHKMERISVGTHASLQYPNFP